MTPPRKPLGISLKDLISSSYFQGSAALASLIAAIASDSLWVRIPALLVIFVFFLALRPVVCPWFRNGLIWLTWKFALGVVVGIITGVLLLPLLKPVYMFGVSLFVPHVEILDSDPQDGGKLQYLHSSVSINFSERIPGQFRSPLFNNPYFNAIKVEITPDIPISLHWLYQDDLAECCRELDIRSNKYFPKTNGPQFEPNKTYHLRISGFLLKTPVDIKFYTPSQGF